jgi:hypothetical protein
MSDQIERPIFYEGQILGAEHLERTVDHARGQQARHERHLHLWGIANGLALTGKGKQTAQGVNYQEVTLSAGMAIDGTGREIVVPEAERLSEDLFDQLNVAINVTEAWYPVFLIGRDEPAPQPPIAIGTCDSSQPTRVVEGYEVTFGRPGDELDLDTQDVPEVADGPGNGTWRVLLGFVQWDATIKHFKAVANESSGIGRRYAGVQADEVAARGGRLTLRSRSRLEVGKPAVVMDETDGGLLQFGLLTTPGVVTPVFSVNSKGDVTAEGTIAGAVTPGSVQVQSGIAMDGVLLPLPPGIKPEDIEVGKVTLHSHVTPQITQAQAPDPSSTWGVITLECRVGSDRRIHCQVRWFKIGGTSTDILDQATLCDYTAIVSVPATTGNGP